MTRSMRWPTYPHRSTYQWTDLPRVPVQLVSLLQWHRQCDDPLIALPTSESVCRLVRVQLVSLLQWHHSTSHSEPATIGISILHKAKKIHSCGHESLKRGGNVTILATHLRWWLCWWLCWWLFWELSPIARR